MTFVSNDILIIRAFQALSFPNSSGRRVCELPKLTTTPNTVQASLVFEYINCIYCLCGVWNRTPEPSIPGPIP